MAVQEALKQAVLGFEPGTCRDFPQYGSAWIPHRSGWALGLCCEDFTSDAGAVRGRVESYWFINTLSLAVPLVGQLLSKDLVLNSL